MRAGGEGGKDEGDRGRLGGGKLKMTLNIRVCCDLFVFYIIMMELSGAP